MTSAATDIKQVADDLVRLELEAQACRVCPLGGTRTQAVFGTGDPTADLMFVGEAPGFNEDKQGEPFVGRAGELLNRLIREEIGLRRSDVYIANVLKCRPPDNRNPYPAEIDACRPFLVRQLELVAPKIVVTLGNFATKLLLDTDTGITRMRGRRYPYRDGSILIPTYHPAAALRGGNAMAGLREDLGVVRDTLEQIVLGAADVGGSDAESEGDEQLGLF